MQNVKFVWQTALAPEHWNVQLVKLSRAVVRQPESPAAQMLSPSGISLHALTSFFRVVRHVFLHDFFVVGTFATHLSSLVKHFVAHFWPSVPAKHLAYADSKVFLQSAACVLTHCLNACRASLTQARVAGLNGCGSSVVLVDVVVLVVVTDVAVCARAVAVTSTAPARIPAARIVDARIIVKSPCRGRRHSGRPRLLCGSSK
jgi:hypothetical protein